MIEQLNPEKILQTGMAFWASKTLLSAVEMGVFTELSHGPESFDSLSGRLGLYPRSARDFLDTFVALDSWNETLMYMATRPRLTSSSTERNLPTWEVFLKWPIIVSIHSGVTSLRRFVLGCRKTKSRMVLLVFSKLFTPTLRT